MTTEEPTPAAPTPDRLIKDPANGGVPHGHSAASVLEPGRPRARRMRGASRERGLPLSVTPVRSSPVQELRPGSHLGSAARQKSTTSFVTYGKRLLDAAIAAGLPADSPA
jgi:hypothetical protein